MASLVPAKFLLRSKCESRRSSRGFELYTERRVVARSLCSTQKPQQHAKDAQQVALRDGLPAFSASIALDMARSISAIRLSP